MSDVLELARELLNSASQKAGLRPHWQTYEALALDRAPVFARAVIDLSARVEELENKIATDEAAVKEYNELMQKITIHAKPLPAKRIRGSRGMQIEDEQLASILLCAFRYSLGRTTYITGDCADWLRRYWSIMPASWQKQIHSDITQALASGRAGHKCDEDAWRTVLQLPLKEEPRP